MRPRGVFITGTDTDIGKTTYCRDLCAQRPDAVYWKPVQTGFPTDDDTATVGATRSLPGLRFRDPVSPHLAAAREGVTLTLDALLAPWREWRAAHPNDDAPFVVEGAGGVLVPLAPGLMLPDLMAAVGLPVAVVARDRVGTINHTLLTVEALRARDLAVAGVVLVGGNSNREAIETYGDVPVIENPLGVSACR